MILYFITGMGPLRNVPSMQDMIDVDGVPDGSSFLWMSSLRTDGEFMEFVEVISQRIKTKRHRQTIVQNLRINTDRRSYVQKKD